MQEDYKVYYREKDGSLGVTKVSCVVDHVQAINLFKSELGHKGVVLTVINKGDVTNAS